MSAAASARMRSCMGACLPFQCRKALKEITEKQLLNREVNEDCELVRTALTN